MHTMFLQQTTFKTHKNSVTNFPNLAAGNECIEFIQCFEQHQQREHQQKEKTKFQISHRTFVEDRELKVNLGPGEPYKLPVHNNLGSSTNCHYNINCVSFYVFCFDPYMVLHSSLYEGWFFNWFRPKSFKYPIT